VRFCCPDHSGRPRSRPVELSKIAHGLIARANSNATAEGPCQLTLPRPSRPCGDGRRAVPN
jgi:hypothetical protein